MGAMRQKIGNREKQGGVEEGGGGESEVSSI